MPSPLEIMMQMVMGGQNPEFIMNQMLQQNPQLQVIMNQARQSGMSPRDYTLQYARQNNINIQPLVNMFAQRGIKL
jgi:hypothetical protein